LAQLVHAQQDGDVDAEAAEQFCRVRALLSERLIEHPRFVIIALTDVPIDVLAERLEPTRGGAV